MKNIPRVWAVYLGCALTLLVCGGLCVNAFSVTQPYILAQNGFTNTQTSMITTACSVTFLLCMFVANAYYEKLGYRVGLTLAVGLGAGSFVLFAEAKTLLSYYLAGMLAGVSYGLGAMLPASILMLRWFSSHRGTAIGICAAGTGISAVVFSPILSARIERFSLRVCFYFEALVALFVAALVFLLIRESPESCGLAFSFMPGAFADLTWSYAPAYIVFTLFAVFTLLTVQSTYRLGRTTDARV